MKNYIICPKTNAKVVKEVNFFIKKFNQSEEFKKFSPHEWEWDSALHPEIYFTADNIVILDSKEIAPLINFLSGMTFSYRILKNTLLNNGEYGAQINEQLSANGFRPKNIFYVYDDLVNTPLTEKQDGLSSAILINGGLQNFENEVLLNFIKEEESSFSG